jgi:hypothetical protein
LEINKSKTKKEIISLFNKLIYYEHLLFVKTEKLKKSFGESFSSSPEQINFCKQLFDSISTFNKPLETRGYERYLDPKYQKMLSNNSRFTQRALELKGLNDEVRIRHNFPVLTFKEMHLLSLHYNVSHGDSIYLQEFMFILLSTPLMFRFFETVGPNEFPNSQEYFPEPDHNRDHQL